MSERNTGDVALEPSINGFYPLAILLFLIVVGMVSQRLLFFTKGCACDRCRYRCKCNRI